MKNNRARKGFSMVELLVSSLVTMVGVVGMFSLYGFCQLTILTVRHENLATQLARADVERAKTVGYNNLPLGTWNSGTSSGTWTGNVEYYDASGTRLKDSANAEYKVQRTVVDTGMTGQGTTYQLTPTGARVVRVVVSRASNNAQLVVMGTRLSQGGI